MIRTLSPHQVQTLKESNGRVNLWEGAIRSGKTIASIFRWMYFINAMRGHSGDLVMAGRTRDSVWRNVIGPMQDPNIFGDAAREVLGNYGSSYIKFLGRRIYIMGASDVKAETVLRGLTVLGAYVDEITVIPETFFAQLLGRMSPPGARMFGTTNPDGPKHWLKTKYLDRMSKGELDGWRRFHFNLNREDNPSLTEDYIASIKSESTGLWYKRFVEGLWVQAEGAIYSMWDDRMIVDEHEIPTIDRYVSMGIDYGTTNATRGELIGLATKPVPRLYVVDEWAPGRLTDAKFSYSLRQWLSERSAQAPEWIFVDPAAASFKLQLFNDGISNLANGVNDVLDGIRTVASLLSAGRLYVSSRCKNLLDEIPGYVWDPKAGERGVEQPVKQDDHALDALRYAIHSSQFMWQDALPVVSIPTQREETESDYLRPSERMAAQGSWA